MDDSSSFHREEKSRVRETRNKKKLAFLTGHPELISSFFRLKIAGNLF